MAITQDTFTQYSQIGYDGQLNTDFPWWASSPHAEGGDIPFGVGVAFGTNDNQGIVVPEGVAPEQIIGFTLRTQSVENNAADESVYREGRAMSVLQKGRMYVVADAPSNAGAPVFVVPGTGEIAVTDGGTPDAPGPNVQVPRARFVRTADSGEVTEIELG